MLLTPSGNVVESLEDGGIRYRFRVISLAAMDGQKVLEWGNPCLMPFVALMRRGSEIFQRAEEAAVPAGSVEKSRNIRNRGLAAGTGLFVSRLKTGAKI
jgi:hypothetical protein